MNSDFLKIFRDYQEISVRYDDKHKAVWCYYNPQPRPCFTPLMLKEIRQYLQSIINYFSSEGSDVNIIRYLVNGSQVPGVFSMGGDLSHISSLIRERDRSQLLEYATQCIDVLYLHSVNLNLPLTTISLVEGAALGGGFECALSSNVLIATENSEMGFPEIRFNLFPGMGAYSFLARSCGTRIAEKIIGGGQTFSAKKLYDMGIVHYLGESGRAVESVEKYIRQHQPCGNGHRALQQVRQCFNPISYRELKQITEIWVDAALRLEEDNLRLIDRLIKAQSLRMTRSDSKTLIRTSQDRRITTTDPVFPLLDWSGRTVIFDRRKIYDRRLAN